MKAEEFVEKMHRAMPSAESLRDYGLDDGEIHEIQNCFRAPPKGALECITDGAGEIGRLICLYDCTSVEVGLIRFDANVTQLCEGRRFGMCEADPLVVSPSGAVLMCDHAIPASVTFRCASDPGRFLDALAEFLRIQSERTVWKGRADEAADRCRVASGESQSVPFYRALCSYLNS